VTVKLPSLGCRDKEPNPSTPLGHMKKSLALQHLEVVRWNTRSVLESRMTHEHLPQVVHRLDHKEGLAVEAVCFDKSQE